MEENLFQTMYHTMFNAATDALAALAEQNFGQAAQFLRQGQQQAEEIFLNFEEAPEENPE